MISQVNYEIVEGAKSTKSPGRDHQTTEVPNPVDREKKEKENLHKPPPPLITILLYGRVL